MYYVHLLAFFINPEKLVMKYKEEKYKKKNTFALTICT